MDSTQLIAALSPEEMDAYNDLIKLARQDLNFTLAIWVTMLVSSILFILTALYLICKSTKI